MTQVTKDQIRDALCRLRDAAYGIQINDADQIDADYAILQSALDAGGDAWQPIESAPRDGAEILTLTMRHWVQGTWAKNGAPIETPRVDKIYHVASFDKGEWVVAEKGDGYEYQKITVEPTNWQPLPAPPALTQPSTTGAGE
jgi:hypothetical protein